MLINELRKNNFPKENPLDILKQYNDRDDIFITFTDDVGSLSHNEKGRNISGAKLGINPKSIYKTPIGIYSYPLKASWKYYNIDENGIKKGFPFASIQPYIWIFQVSGNIINDRDMWQKTRSEALKQTNDDEKKASRKWTSICRKLGIDGFIDYGDGYIHSSEPCQAVFFNMNVIKPIKLVHNKKPLTIDPRNIEPEIEYWPNGNKHYEKYKINGDYYRINGPAYIEYDKNGKISCEKYYENGQYHRLNGPALIEYYENRNIKSEEYYKNDLLHRLDGPAIIQYYENKNKITERYYKNGQYHRLDGPAVISYDQNRNITLKEYLVNGKYHKLDGPAYIEYENGKISCEKYYENGEYHKLDGPAVISYSQNGTIRTQQYWINGKYLTKEKFLRKTNKN